MAASFATGAEAQSIRFHQPLPGADTNLVSVETARVLDAWHWTAGVYIDYAHEPLVLASTATDDTIAFIEHQVLADALVAFAFPYGLELGLGMPVTLFQSSEDSATPTGEVLPKAAAGDLRILPKWQIYKDPSGFGVALSLPITVPTGDTDAYSGNGGTTVEPRITVDGDIGDRVRLALNVGWIARTEARVRVGQRFGHELRLAAGAQVAILPSRLAFIAEAIAKLAADPDTENTIYSSPIELGGAFRYWFTPEHALTLGAGFGLTQGYGAPDAHVYLGYAYQAKPDPDTDGDGLKDRVDGCPTEPEDFDKFEDSDGCPDPDNDKDTLLDAKDKCPNEAEDFDKFEDVDGCPDPDNDGDKKLDVDDKCANDPEDYDEFEDADGCPEPDNDQDGFLDPNDKCPVEPETKNGFMDDDGCPDEKAALTRGEIKVQPVNFDTNAATLRPDAFPILNEVVTILKAHPDIAAVEIQGHTDERNTDRYNQRLSQKRAKTVFDYLVSQGIDKARLTAKGFGESMPVVDGHDEAAWAANRRVVFKITRYSDGSVPD